MTTSSTIKDTYRAIFTVAGENVAKSTVDALAEMFDADTTALAAFERPDQQWDIALNFEDAPDQAFVRSIVKNAAPEAASSLTFDTVEAKDWVKSSLEGLVPVAAGRFIVHGQHDRARVSPNKISIEIEAALAFGTGHHGTTRGCLLLLDQVLRAKSPRRILDLGCGTGVLAIAAAKATHRRVLASDIDPASVAVARENARLNSAAHLVDICCATGFAAPVIRQRRPFDLILANILANPLRSLATPMRTHAAPRANIILSGLLRDQAAGVIAAYLSRGFVLKRQLMIEGWCSLLLEDRG